MNEWQAKYEALAMGCTKEHIDVADILVQKAIDISCVTGISFDQVFEGMKSVITYMQNGEFKTLMDKEIKV